MDELDRLEDSELLWDVINPILKQYNPSDRCVGTLCINIVCQIFVANEIDREEFLRQSEACYDLHFQRAIGRKNDR